ncbi:MAG: T9SS type A sorting domain-containing protein [Candidatus Cloacimonetes bacterium]|nr:T9SS type A sorting domain-containing protein [Candidatus Cloacimonadota bacterium]
MKRLLLLTLMVAFTIMSFAVTLNVAIDGSEQYSSIQAAIEAANSGDTILVHPGRYIENIDYIGKSITVCSLEATTNDSTYISQTIIDGNRNGSCVAFRNAEQNATLRGFTITNGTGYFTYDEYTRGGGVLVYIDCNVSLINCEITGNYAGSGAGLSTSKCSVFLSGLRIHNNFALTNCGGISHVGTRTHYPSIVYDSANRCSVYSNYGAAPVDIGLYDIAANISINLDVSTVNPVYPFYIDRFINFTELLQYYDTVVTQQAYRSEINHDLYVSPYGDDDNSGLSSDVPMRTITKAVHLIASDSLNAKTVHLLPGVYEEGEDQQIYPIPIKSYTNLIGAGAGVVTLYSETESTIGYPIFIFAVRTTHSSISGMKITGSTSNTRSILVNSFSQHHMNMSDIQIVDLSVSDFGGVLLMSKPTSVIIDKLVIENVSTLETVLQMSEVSNTKISNSTFTNINSTYVSDDPLFSGLSMISIWVADSLTIENCEFSNISVQNDQPTFGISIWNNLTTQDVSIKINNCLFDNIRTNNDRAIFLGSNNNSSLEVNNCTFYDNYGSVAVVGLIGNVSMRNNVFYNPDANKEIVMYNPSAQQPACNLNVDYSYIRGGTANIQNTSFINTLAYGEHNISEGSLFASTTAGSADYLRLADASPCIDAGTPDVNALELLPFDLAGNWRVWDGRIDMGCYEYGSVPWVDNDDPFIPAVENVISATNYPNPFNPSTTIDFSLPVAGIATLEIYNLKGQKVRQLLNSPLPSGSHKAVWDGINDFGQPVSSGIYFYRVNCNKQAFTGKMILAK